MPTESLVKRKDVEGDEGFGKMDAISHLMHMKEVSEYFYGPQKGRGAKEQQLRLMALLCTIKTARQVAATFGVGERLVKRAWRLFRDELKDASITRNTIIAGMAERKVVEAISSLDVSKVSDDRKGRLAKDLMDSAALANERIAPVADKKDEDTMELVLRVRSKMSKPRPVDVTDNIVDAEVVEEKQIPEKTK
jgi:hypothetical protein